MTSEPGMLQVVLMGMITVFIVLICIIGIITLMGKIMVSVTGKQKVAPAPATPAAPAAQPVGNKQQLVAAIAAVIAEDMGESVDHIRIHSIRKL